MFENIQKPIQLITETLADWYTSLIQLLPNIIVAALSLILFYILGLTVSRVMRQFLDRVLKNVSLNRFLATLTHMIIFFAGILIALSILHLNQAIFSLLTGVGIVGIALGFAFQDMASNLISGIALVFRDDRPFKVGDIVETQSYLGIIDEINLRSSLIRTFDGQSVFIPNKLIYQEAVINYSILKKRRVDLEVGISYGENLDTVKSVVTTALKKLNTVPIISDIEFFYSEFGDSSINFEVRFWIPFKKQTDFLHAKSEAIIGIKKAFDQNDIMIPFPIRTLDFGIKGGKTLEQMLAGTNT